MFERLIGPGKKTQKLIKPKLQQLKRLLDKNDRVLIYSSATKVTPPGYLHKTITKKLNIKYPNKNVLPKQTEKRNGYPKKKCDRLFKKFSDRGFILNDETYLKLTHSTFNDSSLASPRFSLSSNSILKRNSKVRSTFDCDGTDRFKSFVHPNVCVRCQWPTTSENMHSASSDVLHSLKLQQR